MTLIAHISVRDICVTGPNTFPISQLFLHKTLRIALEYKKPYCWKLIFDLGPQKILAAKFRSLRAQNWNLAAKIF